MDNKREISRLLLEALQLLDNSRLLNKSVSFTNKLIDELNIEENIDDIKIYHQSKILWSRLKIDYQELIKIETEYEVIRLKVNKLGREVLPPLEPSEPMDFEF